VPVGDRAEQPLELDRFLISERRAGDGGAAVERQTMHKDIFVDWWLQRKRRHQPGTQARSLDELPPALEHQHVAADAVEVAEPLAAADDREADSLCLGGGQKARSPRLKVRP
jgi:hypothetical protein